MNTKTKMIMPKMNTFCQLFCTKRRRKNPIEIFTRLIPVVQNGPIMYDQNARPSFQSAGMSFAERPAPCWTMPTKQTVTMMAITYKRG